MEYRFRRPGPAFIPSGAYIVYGHGKEIPGDTLLLPPTASVLVKARPGERIWESVFPLMVKRVACLPQDIITNPFHGKNMIEIVNITKDIMAYLPGETCPNFKFNVLSYFDGGLFSTFSGIVPLSPEECERKDTLKQVLVDVQQPAREVLLPMFERSVFPTKDELHQKITDWESEHNKVMRVKDIVEKNSPFKTNFDIDLKIIVNRFPGVLYNFVCRDIQNVSHHIYREATMKGNTLVREQPLQYARLKNVPSEYQNVYRRSIVEAERRKKYAPGSYLNVNYPVNASIHNAIEQESLGLIKIALSKGNDPNDRVENKSPLKAVLESSSPHFKSITIPFLIKAGANSHEPGLLETTFRQNDDRSFKLLLDLGVDFLNDVSFDESLLATLISEYDEQKTKFLSILLSYIPKDYFITPLSDGDPLIFKYLKQQSILKPEIFTTLLSQNPAQLTLTNTNGFTLMDEALETIKDKAVKALLDVGFPIEFENAVGLTPLGVFFQVLQTVPKKRKATIVNRLLPILLEKSPNVTGIFSETGETYLEILLRLQNDGAIFDSQVIRMFKQLYTSQNGPQQELLEQLENFGGGYRKRSKTRRHRRQSRSLNRKHKSH